MGGDVMSMAYQREALSREACLTAVLSNTVHFDCLEIWWGRQVAEQTIGPCLTCQSYLRSRYHFGWPEARLRNVHFPSYAFAAETIGTKAEQTCA